MATDFLADFGDGEYRFWLPLPQLFAFERDHGPLLEFWGKLADSIGIDSEGKFQFLGPNGASAAAMHDLVRVALIGGNHGMVNGEEVEVGPTTAKNLARDYLFPHRPLAEAAALSFRIADAYVRGVEVKKKAASETELTTSQSDLSEAKS